MFAIDAEPLKGALAQLEAQWARDKALADNAVDTETRLKPLMKKQTCRPRISRRRSIPDFLAGDG